ncbi:MAG: Macrolide export ATP-binding/permease protein MacB [bacterium]|nr:Macrolide export ATP-binding/permease protein MacB [bacterium]MCK6558871.1 ABC transporter permease [bacterium]NUM63929.1 ABC transporter permease [candidate division KSB1 bacterium]
MQYSENLQIGLRSVMVHKLRSLLTTLGIIFGVAAVIAMLSIGEGAKRAAVEQIKLLGTNNVRVKHRPLTGEMAEQAEAKLSPGLNYFDALYIRSNLDGMTAVAPMRFVESAVLLGAREATARVIATNELYETVTNFHPKMGRFLTALDVADAKRVCVIGAEVRRQLFGYRDPLGHRLKIEDTWFTVVGVMESKDLLDKKASVIKLRNINQDVYIPISTGLKRFTDPDRPEFIDEIAIQVNDEGRVFSVSNVVKRMLQRMHNQVEDYEIIIPSELLAQSQRTQRVFNIVMGSIAAISLIVGGIGIMNIMLASVTERTKEIGVRRALGATQEDILGQFLNETVLISVTGGLIGIILGAIMAKVITWYAGWDTVISLFSVVISFGISGMVGIIFGIYPARKAAQMDPIAALRFE